MKEFITELSQRLEGFTHEELKEIILERARNLPPRERAPYLAQFVSPPKRKTGLRPSEEGNRLLKEIRAFGERVRSYEYTTGWGWDDAYGDERAWGDDSWVGEVDDLFERIDRVFAAGDYGLARRAYRELFRIYNGGIEESQLSGYDHDSMMDTDPEEAALKYLRCVYLTEKPSRRPAVLFKEFSDLRGPGLGLNFHGVIQVSLDDLPGLDEFGKTWIAYLKREGKDRIAIELLKEAVRLFQGTGGLETLARDQGREFPGAFVEWLAALGKEKKYEEMIDAARLGLETLSESLEIRADIADYLHEAAKNLNRKDLVEFSLREALHASPSLDRLMNLLDCIDRRSRREERIREALARFEVIRARNERTNGGYMEFILSQDFTENSVPEGLEIYCYLFLGDYARVASLMTESAPLGWSYPESPGAIAVPFFLYARWNAEKPLAANMAGLWNEQVTRRKGFLEGRSFEEDEEEETEEVNSRLRGYLNRALQEYPLTEEDKDRYFGLAEEKARERIDAIVSNKHRKSYWKAARLLLAVAETYWSNDQKKKGQALIDQFTERYKHYSAFRKELRTMAGKSRLFSVR